MKTSIVAILGLIVMSTGCAAAQVEQQPRTAHRGDHRDAGTVDVYLDAAPERPFEVVSVLNANGLESTNSIESMRAQAAKNGLDGIYWIDCAAPGSGRCSAKGFVYTSLVPSLQVASTSNPRSIVEHGARERRIVSDQ